VVAQLLIRAVQLLGGAAPFYLRHEEAVDPKAEDEQAFCEFVTSQMASLRKLAYMICGDWHTAEDAVANALVKLYPRRKLERPDLYVKTMVDRAAIDETGRPWRRERSARCHAGGRGAGPGRRHRRADAAALLLPALSVRQGASAVSPRVHLRFRGGQQRLR